jgi:hypothetical protein
MPHDSPATILACARCGAAESLAVEGLCSQCLLRLALPSEPAKDKALPDSPAPALARDANLAG